MKDILCSEPLLQHPKFDEPFLVTCDASHIAVAAVLSQVKIGADLPIAYASRALSGAELNYSVTEKELIGLVFAVKQFRPYLYGRPFKLITDHRPLVWLHNIKNPTSRLARWKEKLRDYEYEVIHKPGKINSNADALSRNPVLTINKTHPETKNTINVANIEAYIANIFIIEKGAEHNQISFDDEYTYFYIDETGSEGEEVSPPPSPSLRSTQEPLHTMCQVLSLNKLTFTRDSLMMQDDNWINFMPLDYKIETSINKQLMDLGYLNIDDLKSLKLEIGAIVESGLNNGKCLFTLFVQEKHDITPQLNTFLESFESLYSTLLEKQINSISFAKYDDALKELPWLKIEQNLRSYWSEINLTICTGEVITPEVADRPHIIRESHDSAVAGHKGIFKTYARVRERFYWDGMKNDIVNYVKTCEDCQKRKLVRVRTKLPMKITTTPFKAFQLIELDFTIVWLSI